MLKKCLNLFIMGIVLILIGGIGLSVLGFNGLLKTPLTLPVSSPSDTYDYMIPVDETDEIHSLDFSANAGIFKIVKGDSFFIEINGFSQENFGYEIADGCLKIDNSVPEYFMNFNFSDADAEIIVTVPEKKFKKVTLSLNAGEFSADNITTDDLVINLNAGSAEFNNIVAASSTEINMNLGECIFENSTFNDAEINMDAGEMSFEECKLTGNNDINLDIGELNMELIGKRSDYEFKVNNDLGEVTIDGEVVATTVLVEVTEDETVENVIEPIGTIDIELDLGECNIEFTEE